MRRDVDTRTNAEIEQDKHDLPDKVATAEEEWVKAEMEREEAEAKLYLEFKIQDAKRTADEIKSMILLSSISHAARIKESLAKIEYKKLNNRLKVLLRY